MVLEIPLGQSTEPKIDYSEKYKLKFIFKNVQALLTFFLSKVLQNNNPFKEILNFEKDIDMLLYGECNHFRKIQFYMLSIFIAKLSIELIKNTKKKVL